MNHRIVITFLKFVPIEIAMAVHFNFNPEQIKSLFIERDEVYIYCYDCNMSLEEVIETKECLGKIIS